ncbi:hypothetical protein LJR030_004032 [Rhizobium sp. LjRoot30]|uniref:hypothetical protein n=1 Tax=Rhizobium sp. LjRoot30 TaxID=3342320 RepID=UPI003ECF3604
MVAETDDGTYIPFFPTGAVSGRPVIKLAGKPVFSGRSDVKAMSHPNISAEAAAKEVDAFIRKWNKQSEN